MKKHAVHPTTHHTSNKNIIVGHSFLDHLEENELLRLANFSQLQKPNISLEKVGFGCKKKNQIQWKAFASFSLVFEAYIYIYSFIIMIVY